LIFTGIAGKDPGEDVYLFFTNDIFAINKYKVISEAVPGCKQGFAEKNKFFLGRIQVIIF
jgi:hypothetical protein